jgi:hypothetical protein
VRLPPTFIPVTPWSKPAITLVLPTVYAKGALPAELSNWVPLKLAAVVLYSQPV